VHAAQHRLGADRGEDGQADRQPQRPARAPPVTAGGHGNRHVYTLAANGPIDQALPADMSDTLPYPGQGLVDTLAQAIHGS
jgi:hypothetical protein